MRTFLTHLVAAGGLLATVAAPAAAQDANAKIAFIDSRRIIAEAPGAQEAQQAFEKDMAGYRGELQKLEEELKTMISEYEKQQVMLSPEAKQQREEAIRQKQREYQQRAEQLEEQAAKRQAELVEPIMDRINTVIGDIRQEGGYALIFDAAAGALIAADPSLDITEQVLARLKATASAGASGGSR